MIDLTTEIYNYLQKYQNHGRVFGEDSLVQYLCDGVFKIHCEHEISMSLQHLYTERFGEINKHYDDWLESRYSNYKFGFGDIVTIETNMKKWIASQICYNLRNLEKEFFFKKSKTKKNAIELHPNKFVNEFSQIDFQERDLPTMQPIVINAI